MLDIKEDNSTLILLQVVGTWELWAHEIGGKHTYKDWLFMLKEMTEELTKYY